MRLEEGVAPEALPYVRLIGELLPNDCPETPPNSGFVAVSREQFLFALDHDRAVIEREAIRIPGDLELIDLLRNAVTIRRILGITVGSKLGSEKLLPTLELSVIQGEREKDQPLPCQIVSSHRLLETLRRSSSRLSTSLGFRSYKGELINARLIEALQLAEEELQLDMEEMGEAYPGELPSQLHWLIRLD